MSRTLTSGMVPSLEAEPLVDPVADAPPGPASGMPSSMPIVRIGIWAPRSAMKSKPPRADERVEAAGAELAHLRLDGVHLLRGEHPGEQPAVEVVAGGSSKMIEPGGISTSP